jgi:hypothetical protein
MREPQPLANLEASTPCNRDIFTFYLNYSVLNRDVYSSVSEVNFHSKMKEIYSTTRAARIKKYL